MIIIKTGPPANETRILLGKKPMGILLSFLVGDMLQGFYVCSEQYKALYILLGSKHFFLSSSL